MRKPSGRAGRALAMAATAAAVIAAAAGCGVRPTSVLSAGSMPVADGRASTITVYLVKDRALYPAVRPGLPGHPYLALAQLGVPVTSEERRAGLYTDVRPQEISVTQDGPPGTLTVWVDDPGPRGLRPGPGSRWPRLALAQVACTAQAVPGVKGVLLEAPDEASGHDRVPLDCGDFADLR
ncbi:hypothetical protein [Actinomadura montaniterrae]|uniref:GerMN domain-containing protein n=1 Tax=Actinomadura montaniterrae TaxID=1803903 RepID=A0A6L3W3S8_9ACTN|nr:hypothetical protein [Actinomadura montaniterrae]KAB2382304.1 hypothetical protein F9B16_14455 [Actinomadura montaniterrae]